MLKRNLFVLFTLLFTVVMTVACSSENEEVAQQNNEIEEPATNDNTSEVINEEPTEQLDENTNEEKGNTVNMDTSNSSAKGDKALPEQIELNEEVITETGLILLLESITFEDDHIAVDFHAENHSGFTKYLAIDGVAYDDDLGGLTLKDDKGFAYRYVAESADAMISVKNQETVDATVRFLGKVRDDAETLTLTFNPESGDSDNSPTFTFENIKIPW